MADQHERSKQNNTDLLPFLMDHIPEFFLEKAEAELNETPENKLEILKEMKKIIKTDKNLNDIVFDEDFLNQFLRHSKYKLKKAIARLQHFVALRKKYEAYFLPIPKEDFSRLISGKGITVLPTRSPGGCAIILLELRYWDPEQMPIDDLGRLVFMAVHQSLRDPLTQINGIIGICDMLNISFKQLKHFSPFHMYLSYQGFVECLPARYKELHIVNEPKIFKMVWAVFKNFFSEKLRKRVLFHSSPEKLLEYIPQSVLPCQYGGDLRDFYMTDWFLKAGEQYGKCPMGGQANYY